MSMSTMTARSSTSTRRKTTTGLSALPVDQSQVDSLRLAVAERKWCRAILDLVQELRVRSFPILEVIDRHREIPRVCRQRLDVELPLLIGPCRLDEPRRARPLRRVVGQAPDCVIARAVALRSRHSPSPAA